MSLSCSNWKLEARSHTSIEFQDTFFVIVRGRALWTWSCPCSSTASYRTLLLTLNSTKLLWQPCNPAQRVQLNPSWLMYGCTGEIGKWLIAPTCKSKSFKRTCCLALWAQTDKREYAAVMKEIVENQGLWQSAKVWSQIWCCSNAK